MRKFLTVSLLLALSVAIYAGDPARKGTTGAEQLLIPVGARSIATGGAFLSNVTGLEAIYYNPAGLSQTPGSEAMFSYMSYIADINISYFAIGTNLGDLGSFGFSVKTFDFGNIPVTTFEAPDGDGTTYSPSFLTAGLTYSKVVTDRVSVGINAKVVSETILDVNASAFALDFGVQYRFSDNLSLGAAIKNIGTNMVYSGSNLQFRTGIPGSQPGSTQGIFEVVAEEFQIPSYFELSTAYVHDFNEENSILLGTTFRNNNVMEDQLKFGLEYGFQSMFFVRGGYDLLLENTSDNIFGFTFGAGLNYNFVDGMGFAFDYAYREVKDFPAPNHVFTVKLALD